jgi:hypothetical protein
MLVDIGGAGGGGAIGATLLGRGAGLGAGFGAALALRAGADFLAAAFLGAAFLRVAVRRAFAGRAFFLAVLRRAPARFALATGRFFALAFFFAMSVLSSRVFGILVVRVAPKKSAVICVRRGAARCGMLRSAPQVFVRSHECFPPTRSARCTMSG